MIKKVSYEAKDVQTKLASRIASLEIQLANEQAAKKAIIKYAEELETKLNDKASSEENKNGKEG